MLWVQWTSNCLEGLKRKTHDQGDWGKSAKNPSMLKLVSLLNFGVPTFWELTKTYLSFDVNECLYIVLLK